MKKIETELKFKIENPKTILEKLKNAEFIGSTFQKTIRFENNNELKEKGLFLRVRSGFKNVITLKSKIKGASEDLYKREEIEFEISDIDSMRQIINKLGYNDEMIMEKYRTVFNFKECEIVIDELPFGFFVEIEGDENKIYQVAEILGFNPKDNLKVTYWDVFEKYKEDNNLKELGKSIVFLKNYKRKFFYE